MSTGPQSSAKKDSRQSPLHRSDTFAKAFSQLEELFGLDELIGKAEPHELPDLYSRRARKRLDFGFSKLALDDMRKASELRPSLRPTQGAPVAQGYVDKARLAEILRVDARDRLLSRTSAVDFSTNLAESIQLFRAAKAELKLAGKSDARQLSYVCAHLGAAQTMNFWLEISVNPRGALDSLGAAEFQEAEENFNEAIALDAQYAWAMRFQAHLHALRGQQGDFEIAIGLLNRANETQGAKGAAGSGDAVQSTYHRSLSMLFSYVAVQSDQADAARDSIAAGLRATALDPDEFHAPHSVAASLFWLAHYGPPAEREKHASYLRAAIETARLHAKNSASRASGVLASLVLLEGLLGRGDGKIDREEITAAGMRAKQILDGFEAMGIPADLETRAFSYRTPSIALLRKLAQAPVDDPSSARNEELRKVFEPMIDALSAKLSIPRANRAS